MNRLMQNIKKHACLSGFALKRIAVISMVIDHIGSIVTDGVVAPYATDGYLYFTADMPWLVRNAFFIRDICDILGSVAFPIFCFLIAEGFEHTRDRVKYGVRLGIFALISEIPFDVAHHGELFSFSLQNVMFTLCIGVFTLLLLHRVQTYVPERTKKNVLGVLAVIVGMGVAFAVRSEYVFLGVLAIVLLDVLRDKSWRLVGIAPLLIASPWVLLTLIPLALYNGTRGRGSKYFFYVFYPAHFLVLAGIAYLLAIR